MINSHIIQLLAPKIQTFPSGKEFIHLVGPIKLPVNLDGETHTFQWYSWMKSEKAMESRELIESLATAELAERQQSSVLVYGEFAEAQEALIRMHSICHTGDIFGSKRCDCGFQLEQSMKMIAAHGAGALFYLANHEGRGIGLFSKAMAYLLQEEGLDTVDANLQLGFTDDARNYDDAIAVLRALRTAPVTLITNNPRKLAALQEAGLNVGGRVSLWGDRSSFNEKYLQTKVSRSGHLAENDAWAGEETLLPHAQA